MEPSSGAIEISELVTVDQLGELELHLGTLAPQKWQHLYTLAQDETSIKIFKW